MRRRHALIASTLAVAMLLVGCGSDDDSSDEGGDTTEETTTTTADETTESSEATEDTATDETIDDTEPEDTSIPDPDDTQPDESSPPSEDIEAFCAAYDEFDATASDLPDETLEDIQAGATTLREGLEEMRSVTPDDLGATVDTLIDAFTQLEEIAAEAESVEDAQAAFADAFTEEDAQNAAEGLDTYFNESCPQANDEQAPAEGE
jgi:hypothetical protein